MSDKLAVKRLIANEFLVGMLITNTTTTTRTRASLSMRKKVRTRPAQLVFSGFVVWPVTASTTARRTTADLTTFGSDSARGAIRDLSRIKHRA